MFILGNIIERMKVSDVFFTILYGGALILIIYFIVGLRPSAPSTVVVYGDETPVYDESVIWPWAYGAYNYWPYWYWGGGSGGYGYLPRRGYYGGGGRRWGGGRPYGGGGRGGFGGAPGVSGATGGIGGGGGGRGGGGGGHGGR